MLGLSAEQHYSVMEVKSGKHGQSTNITQSIGLLGDTIYAILKCIDELKQQKNLSSRDVNHIFDTMDEEIKLCWGALQRLSNEDIGKLKSTNRNQNQFHPGLLKHSYKPFKSDLSLF